jgi:L-malate glycosyltransferase
MGVSRDSTQACESVAVELPFEQGNRHEKIRIAFVIDCIQDWNLGGTERQLVHLVKVLDPQVFETVIFVLQYSPAAVSKDVGCAVWMLSKSKKQSRVRCFLDLWHALRKFNPHIVQTYFIDGTFYGATAAWLNRVPIIVQSRRNAGHWQKLHHTLALRALNRVVDYWQCNSRLVAGMLEKEEAIPPERITVLPNSIDVSYFRPSPPDVRSAIRQRLGLPIGAPVFVVVSTLRPVKGLPTFIEAAARVRRQLSNAFFLIVGEGPQRTILSEQIDKSGLRGLVRLEGAQEDLRPWLSAADIGVLASHSESSSNALLEYMAMGLPTVVSDIPANRELVEREFFAAGNADELAERMCWLWSHEQSQQELARQNRNAAMCHGEVSFSELAQNYYAGLALEGKESNQVRSDGG